MPICLFTDIHVILCFTLDFKFKLIYWSQKITNQIVTNYHRLKDDLGLDVH